MQTLCQCISNRVTAAFTALYGHDWTAVFTVVLYPGT